MPIGGFEKYTGAELCVGYYDAQPSCWQDESGDARGIFIDTIKAVADREGWRLSFRYATWDELLAGLRDGQIDIVPAIVRTAEREEFAAFTEESVMTDWGAVYARSGSGIHSVLDLDGRRVGALVNDFWFSGSGSLKELCESFGLEPAYTYYQDYSALFEALGRGEVEAAAASNSLGLVWQPRLPIVSTPVIYNPIELRFAVSRAGRNGAELASYLDQVMLSLKKRSPDFFRKILSEYQVPIRKEYLTPLWVSLALAGFAAVLCIATLVLALQAQALQRSSAASEAASIRLAASKAELETTLDAKELLVHELSHRVKNNLQLVLSLLGLEAGAAEGRTLAAGTTADNANVLEQFREKIFAIALVEEEIHSRGGLNEASLEFFLAGLARRAEGKGHGRGRRLEWELALEGNILVPSAATPLALIVSELAMNGPRRLLSTASDCGGQLRVSVLEDGSGEIVFRYFDLKATPGIDLMTNKDLDFRLIAALVLQLDGSISATDAEDATIRIAIPSHCWTHSADSVCAV